MHEQKTSQSHRKASVIGLIGGMGPWASIDVLSKIRLNTRGNQDQFAIPVNLICNPSMPDRTLFLNDPERYDNPGVFMADSLRMLDLSGSKNVGIACNTAHAPRIWREIETVALELGIRLFHLIQETVKEMDKFKFSTVGLLATPGTYRSRLYQDLFSARNVLCLIPDDDGVDNLWSAIYNPTYGLKSQPRPPSEKAILMVRRESKRLVARGAECVIFGCTEFPLILEYADWPFCIVDPNCILASSLIASVDPDLLVSCRATVIAPTQRLVPRFKI